MPFKDPEKKKLFKQKYYQENKESYRTSTIKSRHKRHQWLYELKKNLKCSKCPENHPACLDFHHRDPADKSANISQMVRGKGCSQESILEEIAKCDVLCSNCHRKMRVYVETE
jgi:hypothetical protein